MNMISLMIQCFHKLCHHCIRSVIEDFQFSTL
ncbi:hypothetical protein JW887_00645 [Candidatus Dojkabacteria bacterium]|nr:hypothetical protein [Candidatus Dojkabacteria bacterium]